MPFVRICRVAGIAFLAFGIAPIWTNAAEPKPAEPTVFTTATVWERPLSSATAALTVIDRQTIDESGARSLAELLRFIPGVDLVSDGTRGGQSMAQIRGGDPNFTLVLLDGVPLNDATYQTGDVFDLAGLPLASIERVEIVRGPLSSFYGSTGLSGVINLITRESGDAPLQAMVGADDAGSLNASVLLSGARNQHTYTLDASFEEVSELVAQERYRQFNLQGGASFVLGAATRLKLSARAGDWESDDYPDASGGPVYGSGELRRSRHEEYSFNAALLFAGDRSQKLTLNHYRHELDRESPAIGFQIPASTELTTYQRSRLAWQTAVIDGDRISLNLGADLSRERGDNRSLLSLPPFLGGDVPGNYDFTRDNAGLYMELLGRRGKWVGELGARVDAPEGEDVAFSPRAGLRYANSSGFGARFSLGRAFKLPSFFALASPRALGGNPELESETSLGGDAAVSFEGRAFGAELTGFYTEFKNLVDFDFDTFLHVNRDRVESRGAELAGWWRPSQVFSLSINLTRQDVEILSTGETPRHRPDWTGGARLNWRPLEKLRFQLDAQAVSQSNDQQIPVQDRFVTAGYTHYGLTGSWNPASAFELRIRINNLTDKQYETLIGYPAPGRTSWISLHYRP